MKKGFLILFVLILIGFTGCATNDTVVPQEKQKENQTEKNYQTNEEKNMPDNQISQAEFPDLKVEVNGEMVNLRDVEIGDTTKVIMKTSHGDVVLRLYREDSPITVENFLRLAKAGFYDGTLFHRVINDFMIQGGDPNSRDENWSTHGTGGPGYRFKDEINDRKIVKGSLAMANAGPNTNGSQFFIVTAEATPWLDGKHTNFGEVVEGMDVVEKIEGVDVDGKDHPLEDVMIEGIVLQ